MEELVFASDHVEWPKEQKSVSLEDIGTKSMCGNGCALEVSTRILQECRQKAGLYRGSE